LGVNVDGAVRPVISKHKLECRIPTPELELAIFVIAESLVDVVGRICEEAIDTTLPAPVFNFAFVAAGLRIPKELGQVPPELRQHLRGNVDRFHG
jgi:hypothetical protein